MRKSSKFENPPQTALKEFDYLPVPNISVGLAKEFLKTDTLVLDITSSERKLSYRIKFEWKIG